MLTFILFYLLVGAGVIHALTVIDDVKWTKEETFEVLIYVFSWPYCLYLFINSRD